MNEAVYWLKFAGFLLLIAFAIYWSLRQALRPREALRNSWWPLAQDEPTWPVVGMAWFGFGFALVMLGLLLHAVATGVR